MAARVDATSGVSCPSAQFAAPAAASALLTRSRAAGFSAFQPFMATFGSPTFAALATAAFSFVSSALILLRGSSALMAPRTSAVTCDTSASTSACASATKRFSCSFMASWLALASSAFTAGIAARRAPLRFLGSARSRTFACRLCSFWCSATTPALSLSSGTLAR
jgi:hypothetical protein